MAVYVASARIDENGNAYGGKPGDQNGKEVSTQAWYAHKKGWVLLRCTDAEKRKKIAKCMRDACANPLIGYDQYQRDTLYNAVKDKGFDVNLLDKAVETDCSALVRVCACYAGIDCPNFRTATQVSVMTKTGFFKKLTDAKYTKSPDYLLEGDVLVTATSGHTVVVLNDGAKASTDTADDAPGATENTVTVADGTYFLRYGPGKEYDHDGQYVMEGTVLNTIDLNDVGGWVPVKVNRDGKTQLRWLGPNAIVGGGKVGT